MQKNGTDRAGVDPVAARRQTLAGLKRHAEIRGFKPGWVFHKYRVLWAETPPKGDIEPEPMLPELRLWVKRQGTLWAKAKRLVEGPRQQTLISDGLMGAAAYSSGLMDEADWGVRL